MKFKSTIVSVNFHVDEARKTVKCYLVYKNKICKGLLPIKTSLPETEHSMRVTGASKCHPNDTFDVTIGKRIAESRAKRMMYIKNHISLKNLYNKYINPLILLESLRDDAAQYKYLASHEKEHIKYLIDNNN